MPSSLGVPQASSQIVSPGAFGSIYLVERHIPCLDELNGIAYDYCELAKTLGRPPMERDWILAT